MVQEQGAESSSQLTTEQPRWKLGWAGLGWAASQGRVYDVLLVTLPWCFKHPCHPLRQGKLPGPDPGHPKAQMKGFGNHLLTCCQELPTHWPQCLWQELFWLELYTWARGSCLKSLSLAQQELGNRSLCFSEEKKKMKNLPETEREGRE